MSPASLLKTSDTMSLHRRPRRIQNPQLANSSQVFSKSSIWQEAHASLAILSVRSSSVSSLS